MEHGVSEQEVLQKRKHEESREFTKTGSELYAKAWYVFSVLLTFRSFVGNFVGNFVDAVYV
jgi:hypothetical protein